MFKLFKFILPILLISFSVCAMNTEKNMRFTPYPFGHTSSPQSAKAAKILSTQVKQPKNIHQELSIFDKANNSDEVIKKSNNFVRAQYVYNIIEDWEKEKGEDQNSEKINAISEHETILKLEAQLQSKKNKKYTTLTGKVNRRAIPTARIIAALKQSNFNRNLAAEKLGIGHTTLGRIILEDNRFIGNISLSQWIKKQREKSKK